MNRKKEEELHYQAGMVIPGEIKLCANTCVYATKEEAAAAGKELMSRWFVPSGCEPLETYKAVNYRFNFEKNKPEMMTRGCV